MVKIDPTTGVKETMLDLSTGSTWLPSPSDTLNAVNTASWNPWPQGGMAGLALHPDFSKGLGRDYAYVTYVHRSLGGTSPSGLFYRNKLVRFTYNSSTNRLESPVVLCDTLPGSKDHNSQRLIIAPVVKNGTNYLFFGSGDMGAGQFENRTRAMKAQNKDSYEGKILRFNLVSDGDAGGAAWIPNDNPYGANTAVYNIGMRNNQGFAYDTATNILYGSSHGPYSDDEINIIQGFKNYGHPLVVGFVDGNYNSNAAATGNENQRVSAGSPFPTSNGVSTCPQIVSELSRVTEINAIASTHGSYKSPLFAAYASTNSTIKNIWLTNSGNVDWESEGWSGLDIYADKVIPGWKRSLINAGLKWGRLVKIQLGSAGTTTLPSNLDSANTADTVTYFRSANRYRDLAFGPSGKDIYVVMDNNSSTSGPGAANPTTPACPGCLIKYSFLGYNDESGLSSISKTIPVSSGTLNACNSANTITIDGTNNFLWVPITGPDGNILAEINAMGQNLGVVTTSFYQKSGALRTAAGMTYLNRNITITPTVTTFATPVKVRLYATKAEVDALLASGTSGTGGNINNIKVLKNQDVCRATMGSTTTTFNTTNTNLVDKQHGANGYVFQTDIPSFSTFYFGNNSVVLPVDQLLFTGNLNNNVNVALNWSTETEINTAYFSLERSIDGTFFDAIKKVDAAGNTTSQQRYGYNDFEILSLAPAAAYYRLKIVDIDGRFKYSNVVKITLPAKFGRMTIYPNPVQNDLKATVYASTQSAGKWKVIDNAGRTILSGSTLLKKGNNQLNIPVNQLASGTYFIKIIASNIDLTSKFVIAGQ